MIGSLTLDQLRVLVAIEETGSFSAAGRRLRRVQSAISHSVQTLEGVHAVQLFDRSGRTPRFTEVGRNLAAQARQVLRQADVFERTARSMASEHEPELALALDDFVPMAPLIRSLAGLQARYPDLTVSLFAEGLGTAQRRVVDGSASVGLGVLRPDVSQDLQSTRLSEVRLVPVVSPAHSLASHTIPLGRDVLGEHVQLLVVDPMLRHTQSAWGVFSNKVMRFVDCAHGLELALAGLGWGNMPHHLVRAHLATGRLVRLTLQDSAEMPTCMGWSAMHHRHNALGKAARWLLADLQRQFVPADEFDSAEPASVVGLVDAQGPVSLCIGESQLL